MEQVIQEFLAESFENLDQLDQDLVNLEQNPKDREIFERIFRTIHTIKGTCGFLAFQKLEEVTHAGENVLSLLRDGKLGLRPDITTQLLTLMDAVRTMLASIESGGNEGDEDYSQLIASLAVIMEEGKAAQAEADSEKKKTKRTAEIGTSGAKKTPARGKRSSAAKKKKDTTTGDSSDAAEVAEDASTQENSEEPDVAPQSTADESSEEEKAPTPPVAAEPATEGQEVSATPTVADSTIRVDVTILDQLMNLVGELVLARNQIMQHTMEMSDSALVNSAQRLNGVTSDLQEAVMKTRMQPISIIWSKLPRFVRDLAIRFGKEVSVRMEGQDTELDKAVIEAMKGSLLHLVRNAVDHGIESPRDRENAGKPRKGALNLRAGHEGGYVVIEVSDDGRGLDRERILARALSRELISPERATRLTDREIENLVFLAGFSTARKVTNVSGRGVGLDVVKTNVEGIGGSIDLQCEAGQKTSIRMKIPLTLAIIPVLIVKEEGQRFAIPQVSVVELVRLDRARAQHGIERIHGVPVYRLRGQLLPLVYLSDELGVGDGLASERDDGHANIAVLHGDDRHFGLVVDAVEDSVEIVVKPLGSLLYGLPFGGATILGDGKVALILDVFRLGLAAGVVAEGREQVVAESEAEKKKAAIQTSKLLYLQGPDDERMAIRFALVSRLEFLSRARVEHVGGQRMIQYRGEILELMNLAQALPERRQRPRSQPEGPGEDAMQVVVCNVEGKRVGIVVNRILDIVDDTLEMQRPASRSGVESCVVIQDRVTEIVDVAAVVRMVDPGFFDRSPQSEVVG
ncbi:MAG: chemotaxis protein CheA [bacterium]|nr:chemotaxis protein CheA [bacterium]